MVTIKDYSFEVGPVQTDSGTVDGEIRAGDNANIDDGTDKLLDNNTRVEGTIGGGVDDWHYTGAITKGNVDPGIDTVRVNGVTTTMDELVAFYEDKIGEANQKPTANFEPVSREGLTVTFDGTLSSDPDGSVEKYAWNFGAGGDATGDNFAAKPTVEFPSSGTYGVTLKVTDNDGATDTVRKQISVEPENQGPTADFNVISRDGLTVVLDGGASSDPDGTIQRWAWNFGADGQATGDNFTRQPEVTFPSSGTYDVILRVTDDDGASDTFRQPVSVQSSGPDETQPSASFSPSTTSPSVGESVTFDAGASSDPDGNIVAYEWDFDGNGTTDASGQVVEHTYQSAGEYPATLTVRDGDGNTATATVTVSVSAPSDGGGSKNQVFVVVIGGLSAIGAAVADIGDAPTR